MSKQSKSNHSSDKENKVHGPVPETRHKWKEEEERVENANGSDDFSVDEALHVPCGGAFVRMQVLTCQASHNGGEGKLSDAEAEREDVYHKHDGGVVFAALTDWRLLVVCGWENRKIKGGELTTYLISGVLRHWLVAS